MLHRKTKEGDRMILRRGDERIYLFFREFCHRSIVVSVEAGGWTVEHAHADKLGEPVSGLTDPPQTG